MVDEDRGSAVRARPDGRKTRADRAVSLTARVYGLILEDIIRGHMRPGDLVQLTALADKFEVSRTPVREALNLLEREGIVTAVAYKGFLVRPIEPRDVRDVFYLRRLVEGAGTELAAGRLTPEDLAALREDTLPDGPVMTLDHDAASRRFHRTIMSAAGSPRLLTMFEDLYNDVRRLQYAGIGAPRPDLIHSEHMDIVAALEAGEPTRARELMEHHIDEARTRALSAWLEG